MERLSADDLMQLASDVGPFPWQVGAILRLDATDGFDRDAAAAAVAQRLAAIPRLRQMVVRTPIGCGRPIWVDAPDFDPRDHIDFARCESPGDEAALLETAVSLWSQRLPAHRPLWRATFVTALEDDRVALVVVFHHVLADGIGGLAMLAALVDGASKAPPVLPSRPPPTRRELAAEALGSRLRALQRSRAAVRTARQAAIELRHTGSAFAPRTTLNRPTGRRRSLRVARADLARLRQVAHAAGGTVNDAILTAISGALAPLIASNGERVDEIVVSVPVSVRATASTGSLGNQVGILAVAVPLHGERLDRLRTIAERTRMQKGATRGASAALLGPFFRLLAAARVLHWFIDRQRMVNAYETNLRGPDAQLTVAGHALLDILPMTGIAGNICLSFAALSYAGQVAIVVVTDPERLPDADPLAAALQQELDVLCASTPDPHDHRACRS